MKRVGEGERLVGVLKERRSRGSGEGDGCYVIVDKRGEYFVVGQRLPCLAAFLNDLTETPFDRVSITGLYENLDKEDGRNGGWHKARWRVRRVPLEQAATEIENARAVVPHKQVVCVGNPICYSTRGGG